jgi:hypothetical protein
MEKTTLVQHYNFGDKEGKCYAFIQEIHKGSVEDRVNGYMKSYNIGDMTCKVIEQKPFMAILRVEIPKNGFSYLVLTDTTVATC